MVTMNGTDDPTETTPRMDEIDRALADFPSHLLDEDGMKAVREKSERMGVDFAPCGVDADNRLIVAVDDGTVIAHDLDTAEPAYEDLGMGLRSAMRWKLNAETEDIAHRQFSHEFMLNRDTSDWVWVHPQWRYLTADGEEGSP